MCNRMATFIDASVEYFKYFLEIYIYLKYFSYLQREYVHINNRYTFQCTAILQSAFKKQKKLKTNFSVHKIHWELFIITRHFRYNGTLGCMQHQERLEIESESI